MSGAAKDCLWPALAGLLALGLFLSTFQVTINGSQHPYATDVGEIQNALPRWGLIHRSGYPLYAATGSLFVTWLRLLGIEPAAGASLVSVVWGVLAVAFLTRLAEELGASGPTAALGGLVFAASTSVWAYASLAEVHTMTLALTVATFLMAIRFGRTGNTGDLLLLTLAFSQGVMHQRSVLLLAPAVLVLVWPHLRSLWRAIVPTIGVAAMAPLTYLYMPLRVWTGATWVFGSPGTWQGFWEMVLDNRVDRVVRWAVRCDVWRLRLATTLRLLGDDLMAPFWILGITGLVAWTVTSRCWREGMGLAAAWVLNLLLTIVIWKNRVGDAQLAAKLPVVALAGPGVALALTLASRRRAAVGTVAGAAVALMLVGWGWRQRPFILSITRDDWAEGVIAKAAQVAPPPEPSDDRQATLMVPWGHTYWALAYAKTFRRDLPGLNVVDHNAGARIVLDRGDRLLFLDETLRVFPVSWWEDLLGRLYLDAVAPGVIEVSTAEPSEPPLALASESFRLENGLCIRSAELAWRDLDTLLLTIRWEALQEIEEDYSVAVHLVASDPPGGPDDVLAQADTRHPVNGWYPTGRWLEREVVQDVYALRVPDEGNPVAVRIAMYRVNDAGDFVNTRWHSLPIPEA